MSREEIKRQRKRIDELVVELEDVRESMLHLSEMVERNRKQVLKQLAEINQPKPKRKSKPKSGDDEVLLA